MRDTVRFNLPARLLHWTMAAVVVVMLFIGVAMVTSVAHYHALVALHRPLGIGILVLAVLRLINRWRHPPPELPVDLPVWQRQAAHASHFLLYGLMLALPLVGWAMLSAAGYPIGLAGSVILPPILPRDPGVYAWLRPVHTVLAYTLFGIVIAHLGAALMHGLVRRDGVLGSIALRLTATQSG